MLNALAIYVEEWYHRNDIQIPSDIKLESKVINDTNKILDILADNNVQATFFILGCVAQEHPELVKRIHRAGHEIASHGYEHNLVYEQTREEFRNDLIKSIQILEEITKEKIVGYSAPSWSIIEKSYWALDILREEGLVYDCSIFPIKTFLYGVANAPRFPYKIRKISEFPPSVIKFLGKNIPFSGGFFFRMMPYWLSRRFIKKINKMEKSVLVYLHSWELNPEQPRLKLPFKKRIIPYANLVRTEKKFCALLKDFRFTSLREALPS